MNSGVYKIENIVTGEMYIGSSVDMAVRQRAHFNDLKRKNHHSIHLQKAFDTYGEQNFTFSVLRECHKEQCREAEQDYLDSLMPKYNVSLLAIGGSNKKFSSTQVATIRWLYKQGVNSSVLSTHFSCSSHTILQISKSRGAYKHDTSVKENLVVLSELSRGSKNKKLCDMQVSKIRWVYSQCKNLSAIAKHFHVAHNTIRKIVKFDEGYNYEVKIVQCFDTLGAVLGNAQKTRYT